MPLTFPTALHQQIAYLALEFFEALGPIDTVLVVNSCARGHATEDSDLDLAVLIDPALPWPAINELESSWAKFSAAQALVAQFKQSGPFKQVHLDVIDGRFTPTIWDEGGGPDSFEVEIGNRVAHSVPLGSTGPYFERLRAEWLPYYGEDLQARRLAMVRAACLHDLDSVATSVERGLHFHAFDRLYKAFQEFLQALFIARAIYPLTYTKWIRLQVEGWLGLPDLYRELPAVLSVGHLESGELTAKADVLRALVGHWVPLSQKTDR